MIELRRFITLRFYDNEIYFEADLIMRREALQ